MLSPTRLNVVSLAIVSLFVGVLGGVDSSAADVIRVTGAFDRSPYQFIDEAGQPAGYDVALVRAAADAVGLEVMMLSDSGALPVSNLKKGFADVVAGMEGEEPQDKIDFCLPNRKLAYRLFKNSGSLVRSIADLREKKIAVVAGSKGESYLRAHGFSDNVVTVERASAALSAVDSDDIEVALLESVEASKLIRSASDLDSVVDLQEVVCEASYGFAVSHLKPGLRNKLEEGMRILEKTGQLNTITSAYFPRTKQVATTRAGGFFSYLLWIIVPLGMLVAAAWINASGLRKKALNRIQKLESDLRDERRSARELKSIVARQQFVLNRMSAVSLVDEVRGQSASRDEEDEGLKPVDDRFESADDSLLS